VYQLKHVAFLFKGFITKERFDMVHPLVPGRAKWLIKMCRGSNGQYLLGKHHSKEDCLSTAT
jgi:hypothetical protein